MKKIISGLAIAILASFPALAEKSSVESVSCTSSSVSLSISDDDNVTASSTTVTELQLRASSGFAWHSLSSSSTVANGTGNDLVITLASADQVSGISSGCEVRLSTSFNSNLFAIDQAIASN